MKKENQPLTFEKIKTAHSERYGEIRSRLAEFESVWQSEGDERLWEEMVFCFFTGGCSAKMGLRSIEAVRPLLMNGNHAELVEALRRPNSTKLTQTGQQLPHFSMLTIHALQAI